MRWHVVEQDLVRWIVTTGDADALDLGGTDARRREDAVRAEQYARSAGLAFLPTIACTPELLSSAGNPAVVTAFISQPTPGQVISDTIPIIGTAQFTSDQALYYKVELSGGQFGGSWVTLGDTHYGSVVNGQLEMLQAPGLQPGNYVLQLVVVGGVRTYDRGVLVLLERPVGDDSC